MHHLLNHFKLTKTHALLVCVFLLITTHTSNAQQLTVPLPTQNEYIRDEAKIINASDAALINKLAAALHNETNDKLFVFTIPSMASKGGRGMRMEQFTNKVIQQWQTQASQTPNRPKHLRTWDQNYILLVISTEDRRVWIEYAVRYARYRNNFYDLLDDHLAPYFNNKEYSTGITHGVKSIAAIITNNPQPSQPVFWGQYLQYIVVGIAVILVAGSIFNSGSNSRVWQGVRIVLALPNHIIAFFKPKHIKPETEEDEEVQSFVGNFNEKTSEESQDEDAEEETEETDEEEEEDEKA